MPGPETATEFLQLLRKETKEMGGMELEKIRRWGFMPSAVIAEFRRRGYELAVEGDRLKLIRERRITTRMNKRRFQQQTLFDMPKVSRKPKGFASTELD